MSQSSYTWIAFSFGLSIGWTITLMSTTSFTQNRLRCASKFVGLSLLGARHKNKYLVTRSEDHRSCETIMHSLLLFFQLPYIGYANWQLTLIVINIHRFRNCNRVYQSIMGNFGSLSYKKRGTPRWILANSLSKRTKHTASAYPSLPPCFIVLANISVNILSKRSTNP